MAGALRILAVALAASTTSGSSRTLGQGEFSSSKSEELGVLQKKMEVLERYSEKPDCFRTAAKSIRLQCGEVEMDEDQRVLAAIGMTLCEIRTGSQHFIPLECQPFDHVNPPQTASWHHHFVRGSHEAGKCVEALSRSAQFWSSYSGYLRELPQLCYAFRRWNEIDLAKDLYRNATIGSISLVQTMMDQEKKLNDALNTWKHDLETVTAHMKLATATVDTSHTSLIVNLRALADGVLLDIRERVIQTLHQNQAVKEELQDAITNHLQTTLLAYEGRVDALNRKFDSYMEDLQRSISAIIAASGQQAGVIMDDMHSRWQRSKLLSNEIQMLSNGTIHGSRRLSRDIHMLHHQVLNLQDEQTHLLSQNSRISSKTSELLSFTHNALEKINNTVMEMDDRFLHVVKHGYQSSWTAWFVWMLEKLIGVESSSVWRIMSTPFLNLVDGVVGLMFTTLRIAVSFCMSATLIFYGVQRHLVGGHRAMGSLKQNTTGDLIVNVDGGALGRRWIPGMNGRGTSVSVESMARGRSESKMEYLGVPVRPRSLVSRIPDRLLVPSC